MSDATSSPRERLPRVGAIAAFLAAGVLLAGIVGLAIGSPELRPWLAVLVGIDAGKGGVSMGSLSVVAPVDVVLLTLTGVTFAGLWPGPGKPRRFWMTLAILLPVAGIAVLAATGLAGRSGLMGGLLVLSCLMFADRSHRSLGYVGLAASLLLLIGDFATTGPPSSLVAGIAAAGYVLLTVWFLLIGARLLGRRRPHQAGAIDAHRERQALGEDRG